MAADKSLWKRMAGMMLAFAFGLSLFVPASVQAATLCASDSWGQTFWLKFTPAFKKKGVSSIAGWVDNGVGYVFPLHGSAIVNAAGTTVRISLEGVNHIGDQRIGIGMDTDKKLNGSGKYQNIDNGTYSVRAETWINVTCPSTYPWSSPDANDLVGGSATSPPYESGQ